MLSLFGCGDGDDLKRAEEARAEEERAREEERHLQNRPVPDEVPPAHFVAAGGGPTTVQYVMDGVSRSVPPPHHAASSAPPQYVVGGGPAPAPSSNPINYVFGVGGGDTAPAAASSGAPTDGVVLGGLGSGLMSLLPVNMTVVPPPAAAASPAPPAPPVMSPAPPSFVVGSMPVVIAEQGAAPTPDFTHALLLDSQRKLTALQEEKTVLESSLKAAQSDAMTSKQLLAARQARIDELETQLRQQAAAAGEQQRSLLEQQQRAQAEQQRMAGDHLQAQVDLLRAQVEELQRAKRSLDDQALIDHATIAKLRAQANDLIAAQNAGKPDASADEQRLRDITFINYTLKGYAEDAKFQEDLRRPLVKVALDCWRGEQRNISDADKDAARLDEGVQRVYPKLKEFERHCDQAGVPFPIDHVMAGKKELASESIAYAYGAEFLARTVGRR